MQSIRCNTCDLIVAPDAHLPGDRSGQIEGCGLRPFEFHTLASMVVSMGLVENRQTSYCQNSFLSNDLLFHLKPDNKKSATISRVPEREPFRDHGVHSNYCFTRLDPSPTHHMAVAYLSHVVFGT